VKFLGSHVSKGQTNEDLEAFGHMVEVAETIPKDGVGRIFFRGTTWPAKNYHHDQDLLKGSNVRIVVRENLDWFVEAEKPELSN